MFEYQDACKTLPSITLVVLRGVVLASAVIARDAVAVARARLSALLAVIRSLAVTI